MIKVHSNLESVWNTYLQQIESPQIYIKFGFLYLIAAALQRRVWIPFGTQNLYPNLFVILTGPPAIGKGRVITQVKDFLSFHERLPDKTSLANIDLGSSFDATQMEKSVIDAANRTDEGKKQPEAEIKPVFPILPDSTSLRSLTSFVAKSFWRAVYTTPDGKRKMEGHSSCAFILEELFNLFKEQKETKDISRFLTCAWDCGDFRHETYCNGKDVVKKMCVSLIAGTTPEFMRQVVGSDLMNEGFASRTLFIWSDTNRFHKFDFGEMTAEQHEAKKHILDHLKVLSEICGPVSFEPAAYEYAKEWYEKRSYLPDFRVNHHYKMDGYYGRKKMHLLKIAMAIHFADSVERIITLADVEKAMEVLEEAEKSMHLALSGKGRNQLAPIAALVFHYIKKYGKQTFNNLLFEFADQVNKTELEEILALLVTTRQLKQEISGNNKMYEILK